jgi:hypothetical protein
MSEKLESFASIAMPLITGVLTMFVALLFHSITKLIDRVDVMMVNTAEQSIRIDYLENRVNAIYNTRTNKNFNQTKP